MITWCLTVGYAVLLALAAPGMAQQPDYDIRQEIEGLKKGQQEIRKQLRDIQRLLQQRRPARQQAPKVRGMVFSLGENPTRGAQTAKLTLIEFTDYQ